MYSQSVQSYMPSVLRTFALSLAISVLGMAIGTQVPAALFLPLAILEIAMLIGAFFLRRKKQSVIHFYTSSPSSQVLLLFQLSPIIQP